ncbi:putative leucine-rich repeat receptor-like protein kinase [Arachis hypogaea]|nr:putative leucine-rich repeat receptor-like protein kinase [Arachis hypogaea]
MEFGSLEGPLPSKLFSIPQIQQVKLRNNALNNTLDLGGNICPLQLVDLQDNQISSVILRSQYKNTLMQLSG